ncbi:MFS transporter [Stutzerimonas kirkiae]|uniref:MFS transporter n=1 Tax=Stutzerimonas kirkiae TaxID=2211392 RepID=A0A4Q9R6L5_9GAMM|nr:MFS transporter [Stutzerimonas kirkiae]TBU96035.1 MFS transporter [Stutzerimonas kirkiae]TBV03133.1 MFS transporter [Stutzerimonas kirkiae]TBV09783.1 MFS transporter [Stutzerimonas kirkiae]TBV13487.1 MFS transporter [Stutzerimonas kirkiae]
MLIFENDYYLAWSLYAVAALGCMLAWFRMTRWMWRWLREPLRLLMAVLLLTPTIVEPTQGIYAPAVAITALDLLFHVGDNAWRAVSDLALYGLIALAAYLLLVLLRWPIERSFRQRAGRQQAGQQQTSADTRPQARAEQRPSVRERLEPRL